MFHFDESTRVILTGLGSLIAIVAHVPYISDTIRGKTKPHAFSWLIWTLLFGIAFASQIANSGGAGAWVTFVLLLLSGLVFVLALAKGEKNITRFDWICLIFSLSAIPIWVLSSSAVWSMVLITCIDVVSFAPTFRKSYSKPAEETLITYAANAVEWLLSVLAMETRSLTTVLYPGSLVFTNFALVIMIIARRQLIGKNG